MGVSIAIPLSRFTLARCRASAAGLFSREGGKKGATRFVGEKGMFHGGAMQADEFGFAEAHLRGYFVFAEERGVEHCGIVGGQHYRNAMAEELRQGMLLERRARIVQLQCERPGAQIAGGANL